MSLKHEDNKPQPIRSLLTDNFYQFIRDVIVPIRVIMAVFFVFLVFLIAEQVLFLIFDWLARDIKTRVAFVGWVLDGVQVVSIVAVSVYFIYSTITNLQSQWHIASKIERRARINEDK